MEQQGVSGGIREGRNECVAKGRECGKMEWNSSGLVEGSGMESVCEREE